jgi:TFIIF-interacting CTD phosphatase-like protein
VLDLDETLVHSSLDGTGQPHFTFPVGGCLGLDTKPVTGRGSSTQHHLCIGVDRLTQRSPLLSLNAVFGGREHHVSVRRRPHLAPFLERVAALFEVVVFTASQKVRFLDHWHSWV